MSEPEMHAALSLMDAVGGTGSREGAVAGARLASVAREVIVAGGNGPLRGARCLMLCVKVLRRSKLSRGGRENLLC